MMLSLHPKKQADRGNIQRPNLLHHGLSKTLMIVPGKLLRVVLGLQELREQSYIQPGIVRIFGCASNSR